MKIRRAWPWVVVVGALAGLAVLIPGTPVYLPNLINWGGRHNGYSTRHWMRTLDSPDTKERHKAIFALGAIGDEAGEAVPALATILVEDSDIEARHQAALALCKMGRAAREAVPALAQALADPEPFVRVNAALALFRLKAEAR